MGIGIGGGLAATAVIGGAIGAGVTALATRNSDSGDGARGAATGLGIAAGASSIAGIAGLAYISRSPDLLDGIINMVFLGLPSMALAGAGVGLGGAALGALLVGATRD
jgi:hypothetical protein